VEDVDEDFSGSGVVGGDELVPTEGSGFYFPDGSVIGFVEALFKFNEELCGLVGLQTGRRREKQMIQVTVD